MADIRLLIDIKFVKKIFILWLFVIVFQRFFARQNHNNNNNNNNNDDDD